MNTIAYLKELYGYNNPIIFKNIRIGGKSKSSIRQELYRATKSGMIYRYTDGVYYFKNSEDSVLAYGIGFEDYIIKKYIKDDFGLNNLNLNVYGFYSGQTFLNMIGISEQVPGKIEITTNNTSSKKRTILINKRYAIIRKAPVEINYQNWRMLQFIEMLQYASKEDLAKNKKILVDYINKYHLTKSLFSACMKGYSAKIFQKIIDTKLIYELK